MKEIMQGIALLALVIFMVWAGVASCSTDTNDCYEYSDGRLLCDDGFEEGP